MPEPHVAGRDHVIEPQERARQRPQHRAVKLWLGEPWDRALIDMGRELDVGAHERVEVEGHVAIARKAPGDHRVLHVVVAHAPDVERLEAQQHGEHAQQREREQPALPLASLDKLAGRAGGGHRRSLLEAASAARAGYGRSARHARCSARLLMRTSDRKLVLLVDDEESYLEIARMLLQAEDDLAVVTARDGRCALHLLDVLEPDVILTDMMMPVLDGFAFLREYKQRPNAAPVIAASGLVAYLAHARELGADAVLPKPFDAVTLIRTVREVLARREPRSDPPECRTRPSRIASRR